MNRVLPAADRGGRPRTSERGGDGAAPPVVAVRRAWAAGRRDLLAAVPGWIAGRVLVAVGAVVADVAIGLRPPESGPAPRRDGLFAWDGFLYREIAEKGYLAISDEAVRFYPLYPRLGVNGFGLIVVSWLAALLAGAVVHRLALDTIDEPTVARRAAFLVGVAPPSFVLVWAYSEALFVALAGATLLALLHKRWWLAGGLGGLAALCRPTGALLALAAGVEGLRGWRAASRQERVARVVAVGGPMIATAAWYAWIGARYGNALLGHDVQDGLRGEFVDPVSRLVESIGDVVTDPFGDGYHGLVAVGLVALVVVAGRRLPAGLSVFAGATVALALTAENLNSLMRYGLSAVPLVVVAAALPRTRVQAAVAAVMSGALLVALCALAWYGVYVP